MDKIKIKLGDVVVKLSIADVFRKYGFDSCIYVEWGQLEELPDLQKAMKAMKDFSVLEVFNLVEKNLVIGKEKMIRSYDSDKEYCIEHNIKFDPTHSTRDKEIDMYEKLVQIQLVRTMNWYQKNVID